MSDIKYGGNSYGALKITSNGDLSEPTFNLQTQTQYQVKYINPILDSEQYFTKEAPSKDISALYGDVTLDGVTYEGVFFENPVLGQPQEWRITFNFSSKAINISEGIVFILRNPLSGFERTLNVTLPDGVADGEFGTVQVSTYADANSLQAPLGTGLGGYQLFIRNTKNQVDVVIKDVSRLNG